MKMFFVRSISGSACHHVFVSIQADLWRCRYKIAPSRVHSVRVTVSWHHMLDDITRCVNVFARGKCMSSACKHTWMPFVLASLNSCTYRWYANTWVIMINAVLKGQHCCKFKFDPSESSTDTTEPKARNTAVTPCVTQLEACHGKLLESCMSASYMCSRTRLVI